MFFVIVALVSVLLYRRRMFSEHALRKDADKLVAALEYARHYAVASNFEQALSINVAEKTYQVAELHDKLCESVQFGAAEHVCGPPSAPTKPINAATSYECHKCLCAPNGALQPGCIYLTNQKETYAITVPVGQSGDVRLYKHECGAWRLLH